MALTWGNRVGATTHFSLSGHRSGTSGGTGPLLNCHGEDLDTTGRSGRAHDRLRATVEAAVRILASHQPSVTPLLRVHGNSALERSALERCRRTDEQLAALVRSAATEGDLRADVDPDVISRLIFGMVNSLVDWYRPDGPLDADVLATTISSVLFDGLDTLPRPEH